MKTDICGCGECEKCKEITENILRNQTQKERDFDRYMTRLPSMEPSEE